MSNKKSFQDIIEEAFKAGQASGIYSERGLDLDSDHDQESAEQYAERIIKEEGLEFEQKYIYVVQSPLMNRKDKK